MMSEKPERPALRPAVRGEKGGFGSPLLMFWKLGKMLREIKGFDDVGDQKILSDVFTSSMHPFRAREGFWLLMKTS
jgi:hypothetical protein